MKRCLTLRLNILALLLLMAFSPQARAYPTINLELPSSPVFVGHSFKLMVVADGIVDIDDFWKLPDEIIAFGFHVIFDLTQFEYQGALIGELFADKSGMSSIPPVAASAIPPVFPEVGPSGDNILLASLNFMPIQHGDFFLGIESDLTSPFEGLFTLVYHQLDITTGIQVKVNPVPEPATIALLGAGLAGLAAMRRRRKQ